MRFLPFLETARQWWPSLTARVTVAVAIVGGAATLLTNFQTISSFFGSGNKEDALKIELRFSSKFDMEDKDGRRREVTLIGKVRKIGTLPARNCKIEGHWDGYPLKIYSSYGDVFSFPAGSVTRDIAVFAEPRKLHMGLSDPRVAIICENVASEELAFEWG